MLFIATSLMPLATCNTSTLKRTIYVDDDGGADYTRIQDAIDAAKSGDAIYVYEGTYNENIEIDKSIELTGENKENTIIDGGGQDDVVYITANNVVVTDFTIENGGELEPHDAGIDIRSNDCIIVDNIIENNNYNGLFLADPGYHNTILSNTIQNNENAAIRISTYYAIIEKNKLLKNRIGISLYSFQANLISNNLITSNLYGLKFNHFEYSKNTKVNLESKSNGLVSHSYDYEIKFNEISNNEHGLITDLPYNWNAHWSNYIHHNNFINNNKNDYKFINNLFDNNYWDEWIGFGSYWIRGTPVIKLLPNPVFILHFNLDKHPSQEPFNIEIFGFKGDKL